MSENCRKAKMGRCRAPLVQTPLRLPLSFLSDASRRGLAAQTSHRKITVTTVVASRLATISLQKSQGFALRRPHKKKTLPKGPCHTKNTTVIVIHNGGSETLRRCSKTLWRGLWNTLFSWGKIHTRNLRKVCELLVYGDSELLCHSIFSTAGSFG